MRELPTTLVLYESTYRIEKLLMELVAEFPNQPTIVARELTKRHETYYRGRPNEVLDALRAGSTKGEFVVLIDNRPVKADSDKVVEP